MSERWDSNNANFVRWVPWRTSEDDANVDGEKLEVIKVEAKTMEERTIEPELEVVPRRAKILNRDLQTHGYAVGCKGRKAATADKPARAHSEQCRKCVLFEGDPRE